jgi:hypothetical protein
MINGGGMDERGFKGRRACGAGALQGTSVLTAVSNGVSSLAGVDARLINPESLDYACYRASEHFEALLVLRLGVWLGGI